MLTGSVEVVRERSRRVTRRASELWIRGPPADIETPNHRPLLLRSSTTASCATIIGCVRSTCRPATSVPSSAPSHLPTFQGHRASPSHPYRPDPRAKSAESSTFNLQKSRTVEGEL